MKTIFATACLFFVAGVAVAGGGQPTQHRGKLSMTDILTYNNFSCQKAAKNNAPKVYATQQESTENKASTQSSSQYNSQTPAQTFTPTPLVNFYKEFR